MINAEEINMRLDAFEKSQEQLIKVLTELNENLADTNILKIVEITKNSSFLNDIESDLLIQKIKSKLNLTQPKE